MLGESIRRKKKLVLKDPVELVKELRGQVDPLGLLTASELKRKLRNMEISPRHKWVDVEPEVRLPFDPFDWR
jgi:hypothetical protein